MQAYLQPSDIDWFSNGALQKVVFASTLLGMKPELSSLKPFGADGEEALYKVFGHVFPRAIHLRWRQCSAGYYWRYLWKASIVRACGRIDSENNEEFGNNNPLQQVGEDGFT